MGWYHTKWVSKCIHRRFEPSDKHTMCLRKMPEVVVMNALLWSGDGNSSSHVFGLTNLYKKHTNNTLGD